jgi:Ca2+-binding RTX toxin-like protein
VLHGEAGNGTLIGGSGRDVLAGAAGADKFDFNSKSETIKGGKRDEVFDFSRGQGDKIDLKDIVLTQAKACAPEVSALQHLTRLKIGPARFPVEMIGKWLP